ncbi:hypothetical protein [Nocardioides sp. LS1]|uniref:hypothetical protein n=1 Tax=Nocardioides sp. LS1 TaxID=1027620 RepID=UPI000FFA6F97|nr:hypothetical protein [Nocardioides sp. LS1]GCD89486.1 hypothetical protein NLS1_14920 [Nocardioides sp. LS1]
MFSPTQWSRVSNQRAVDNARAAATELSRLRVEREDVELFLAEVAERHTAATQPA